jgi:hypothetical protein
MLFDDPKLAWQKDEYSGGYPIHIATFKVGAMPWVSLIRPVGAALMSSSAAMAAAGAIKQHTVFLIFHNLWHGKGLDFTIASWVAGGSTAKR